MHRRVGRRLLTIFFPKGYYCRVTIKPLLLWSSVRYEHFFIPSPPSICLSTRCRHTDPEKTSSDRPYLCARRPLGAFFLYCPWEATSPYHPLEVVYFYFILGVPHFYCTGNFSLSVVLWGFSYHHFDFPRVLWVEVAQLSFFPTLQFLQYLKPIFLWTCNPQSNASPTGGKCSRDLLLVVGTSLPYLLRLRRHLEC